jgi:hypothetical protein
MNTFKKISLGNMPRSGRADNLLCKVTDQLFSKAIAPFYISTCPSTFLSAPGTVSLLNFSQSFPG